jgi:TatD DNase family protein
MLIDTHTHLYLEQFDEDRAAMMERAMSLGVGHFYLPNIDKNSIAGMLQLETDYPGKCHPMMGLHPCSVGADYEEELSVMRTWLEKRPFCAIGEIGLDLFWDKTWFEQQQDAFRRQIRWAKEFNIPIVIHSRESTDECIAIVESEMDEQLRGVFHCFSGTLAQAKQVIGLGFYIGVGGVATFKNGGLDKVLPFVDLRHVVLETDSPYLAPVPHRGKRNESGYLRLIAERVAVLTERSFSEVETITTQNAMELFSYSKTLAG